jgi:hypothetical protein
VTSHLGGFKRSLLLGAELTVALALTLGMVDHLAAQVLGTAGASETAELRSDGAIRVVMDGARVRVEVRDARPADVLRTLGIRSRVPVTVDGELPGRITREFSAVSLEDAVREVVRGYSAALVFGSTVEGHGARLSDVRIIARGNGPSSGEPASPAHAPAATRRDAARPIALAELGTLRAASPLRAALEDPSRMVRTQAVPALGGTDDEPDPDFRRIAARDAGGLGSSEARGAWESAGDPHASSRREITGALARRCGISDDTRRRGLGSPCARRTLGESGGKQPRSGNMSAPPKDGTDAWSGRAPVRGSHDWRSARDGQRQSTNAYHPAHQRSEEVGDDPEPAS